jgi:3-deoxy-7-phosphoheptulonate synthase
VFGAAVVQEQGLVLDDAPGSSRSTALGTHPGGIHIEFGGDDVTVCIGGAKPLPT